MNQELEISQALVDYTIPYAKHVITERAIVDLRDGLKPSQRLGLWAMYEAGLSKGRRMKSAGVSGLVLKYHPHSDEGIYCTLARMAQQDTLLHPLIDSKGNMGQRTSKDTPPSASRYTEMKLAEITGEFFKDINNNSIDMVDNFDFTRKQPSVLPTTFPATLVLGSSGIAVGYASEIPSFNLSEICDYTINSIKHKSNDNLIPDFATGGKLVYDNDEINKINELGRGKLYLRANWNLEEDNIIIIKDIPYTTTREAIIDKIVELIKNNKIREIADVRDATDLSGMKIEIEIRKNINIELLMKKLYKLTPLQSPFSCNMNVISNDKPVLMGAQLIVKKWIDFRKECICKSIQYDIDKINKELNKLHGLRTILNDIDKAIQLIRTSSTEKEAMDKLIIQFNLNQEQAEYIAEIKLIKLNKEWILNKTKSIENLESETHNLQNAINSEEEINNIIIEQLQEIKKKYGQPRKTEIIYEDTIQKITQEEFIEDYNCKIFLTQEGYLKKVKITSIKGKQAHKLKDGDYITHELESNNKSTTLIFTNKGSCYKLYNHEIENTQISNMGIYLKNHLQLQDDEYIVGIVTTADYKENVYIGYENGRIACIKGKSFETKARRSKLDNSLCLDSPVVNIFKLDKDMDIICKSDIDKVLIIDSSKLNPKGSRNTQGVQVLKSKNDSKMTECYPLSNISEDIDYDYYRISGSTGTGKYLRKGEEL